MVFPTLKNVDTVMGVHRKDRVSGWIWVGPTRWYKTNNAPEQVLGELQLSQQLTLHSNHTYRDNKGHNNGKGSSCLHDTATDMPPIPSRLWQISMRVEPTQGKFGIFFGLRNEFKYQFLVRVFLIFLIVQNVKCFTKLHGY